MKKLVFILAVGILMIGCKSESSQSPESGVEHMVFLSLNDSVTTAEVRMIKSKLHSLNRIEGVLDLKLSEPLDVGDARALDYDMLLQLWFIDEAALKSYSVNEYHIQIKKELQPFISGPSATFDKKAN